MCLWNHTGNINKIIHVPKYLHRICEYKCLKNINPDIEGRWSSVLNPVNIFQNQKCLRNGAAALYTMHSSNVTNGTFTGWTFHYLSNWNATNYLERLFLDTETVVSEPWSDCGTSTTSSVVLDAKPAVFFATHVNLPASSGNTSLIMSVATLSSS